MNTSFENYSVLMSVYYKENPEFLRQSIESMLNQTVKTNDFVLVCDGQLTQELEDVLQEFEGKLVLLRLEKNMGLGNALNEGIKLCKNELVARMDSDDISRENRCETQLIIFEKNSEISIISGTVEEFVNDKNEIETSRILPENHDEILRFSKSRNPFNHPCVMYRKSAVMSSGGYKEFYLLEDYYLWIRMLLNGYKGFNIKESLLWMRAGENMYKRRSGWKYAKSQIKLLDFMKNNNFITFSQYSMSLLLRTVSSLSPNFIRKRVFEKWLRSNKRSNIAL